MRCNKQLDGVNLFLTFSFVFPCSWLDSGGVENIYLVKATAVNNIFKSTLLSIYLGDHLVHVITILHLVHVITILLGSYPFLVINYGHVYM